MKIFFITKKLIGTLMMPFQLSLMLIVLGLVLLWLNRMRRLALVLVTAGAALLLIFSNGFVGYHIVHDLEAQYPPFRLAHADENPASSADHHPAEEAGAASPALGPAPLIVVLSGGASNDPELPVADRLSPDSELRVMEAVRIYRSMESSSSKTATLGQSPDEGKPAPSGVPQILMSGGATVNAVPEALAMQRLAESLGVPANAILMETHSDDTASEAKNVLPLAGSKPFILVTSAYHMPRAMALFRHLGMRPIAAPSNYLGRWTTRPFVMNIPPNTGALAQSQKSWHEELGMIWEHLRGQL
jgi:uncharacterized SAM-binding protein YcdF (DUF218 family)